MTLRYRGRGVGRLIATTLLVGMAGCAASRTPVPAAELLVRREAQIEQTASLTRTEFERVLARFRREQVAAQAGAPEPTLDILIISGGGDWGAFGAGFLKGWSTVPRDHPLAKPQFDIVTGVSTGALIAPFAYLGDPESIERIVALYRNPKPDWVRSRGILFFLPNNLSFAEVPGLERELRSNVDRGFIEKLAASRGEGRMLAVGATNLDDASPRVFELIAESEAAIRTDDLDRIHRIMLASAGIPGAFPYREIDGTMYVDGGVTGNIIYGGRVGEESSLPAMWQRMHPDSPLPRMRYWVIFNNDLRTQPTTVEPRWPAIITRSIELSTRSATITAIRHLHAIAEISRLKRGAEVEVRLVAVPDDWIPPVPGVFRSETMNDLADLGERMGADPASWMSEVP